MPIIVVHEVFETAKLYVVGLPLRDWPGFHRGLLAGIGKRWLRRVGRHFFRHIHQRQHRPGGCLGSRAGLRQRTTVYETRGRYQPHREGHQDGSLSVSFAFDVPASEASSCAPIATNMESNKSLKRYECSII